MFKIKVAYVIFLLFLFVPASSAEEKTRRSNKECSIAEAAIETASRLRGLAIRSHVPCRLKGKEEVEKYLRETISKKTPRERIEKEGQVYRMLGIIPKDYDYFNGVIKLYTEQLGGYYDPELKYYAMASWMPLSMQMPIAVHELTHALQDQHFDLDALTGKEEVLSDVMLARSALVEGDATAVMLDYARELAGQPPVSKEKNVSMLMIQNISGAMLSQSLHEAPPAIQASLIFPYVSGLNFTHALLKKGGYRAVDKALRNPPQTTEEVLHPDRYLEGKTAFRDIKDPVPPPGTEGKPVYADRAGEFMIATWLGTWLNPKEASSAAASWAGDKLALYEAKRDARRVLTWDMVFQSPAGRDKFYEALLRAYTIRFGKKPEDDGLRAFYDTGDFGRVQIDKTGETGVKLTIGPV